MAFPQTPLDIQVDLRIGGVWQDVTADVYTRDLMTVTRGRPDEGSRSDPGKCKLLFNNGLSNVSPTVLGRYSPGNPGSDLFGEIGRNTPVRVHVPAAESHLELDGDTSGTVSTPDAAALDIIGDIDIRAEIDIDMTRADLPQTILGKWGESTAERSWILRAYDGNLTFSWLDAATASFNAPLAIELIGAPVIRVVLITDDGDGGLIARFYQGDTVDGPWTQLGDDITAGFTTDLQSTTSSLFIGPVDTTIASGRQPFTGTATRFQVYDGVDGTLVADADFRALADGATGFTDSVGRVWTVNGTAEVRQRDDRFNGEISAWPARWDVSGNDVWTAVEAAGVLRRYGQGAAPLQSPLRRRIPGFSPLAYWPLEEGAQATQAASPIAGVGPLTFTQVDWAQADSLISSAALPVLASSSGTLPRMRGRIPAPASTLTSWSVNWIYRLDTANTTLRTYMRILSTGTVAQWYIQTRNDLSRILGLDADGATVFSLDVATSGDLFGQWVRVRFTATQNGGDVDWRIDWIDVGGDAGGVGDSFTGTVGRPTDVISPPDGFSADLDGMAIGHISAWPSNTTSAYTNAITAWQGEEAGERLLRLGMEENLPLTVRGVIAEQELMGAQGQETVLDLLGECAASDGGILMEHRARPALRYRDRRSLYNQTPALTLDYTADGEVAPPLEPVDDDADTVNDVTVQRTGGSSARAVLENGALSVLAPPDGVGRYDTSVQLSLASDEQTEPIANWRLHLGTWDEPRYPVVHVDLAAAPHLTDAVLAVDQGDLIRITNPPAWLPPGDIDLIVQGYTESFDQYAWDLYFNCTPAGPWNVGAVDDDSPAPSRVDARPGGSTLTAAVDADDTELLVHTPAPGPRPPAPWIYSDGPGIVHPSRAAQFPVDLRIAGEVVRVTASEPAVWDTFTRTTASAWGTADSGQTWTVTGSAADYSVGSGYAVAAQPSTGIAHLTLITAPGPDTDLYADVATDVLAAGASLFSGLLLRAVDNNNHYMLRLDFNTSAGIVATLRKRVSGTETQLATYTSPLTHVAGTFYRARFRAEGSDLKAKVWLASGPEPSLWKLEATDTALTAAASVGTRSFRNTGNTNTSAQMRFDTFTVLTPQALTVQRSVNGITKSQAQGAEVRLARPARIAL